MTTTFPSTHTPAPSASPIRDAPCAMAQRAAYGALDHVAPGDDHDARLETLCVGESR